MTPLQAAKTHCANYRLDGSCLGIYYNDDLSVDGSRYEPRAKCYLSTWERCPYFEQIVLTQLEPDMTRKYRTLCEQNGQAFVDRPRTINIRRCPDCNRRRLKYRRQYCEICAVARKRATSRELQSRRRMRCQQSSPSTSLDPQPLTKALSKGACGSPDMATDGIHNDVPTEAAS